ncbi:MAG: hypothetical protein EAZ89_01685 [Bacteroidetes bacterium]|nr:MAG: hypothetical protein EAZ89_01685 [Bacteroidota bacterium]
MVNRMMLSIAVLITAFSNTTAQDYSTHALSTPVVALHAVKAFGQYQLSYQSETKGDVVVEILDVNNASLYSETVSDADAFSKRFNFSGMPFGVYKVKVSGAAGEVEKEVRFYSPLQKAEFAWQRNEDEQKVKLVFASQPEVPMTLHIYDETGLELYSESIAGGKAFEQVYNLEQVSASSVRFVLSDDKGGQSTHVVALR